MSEMCLLKKSPPRLVMPLITYLRPALIVPLRSHQSSLKKLRHFLKQSNFHTLLTKTTSFPSCYTIFTTYFPSPLLSSLIYLFNYVPSRCFQERSSRPNT
eukprot:Pompholyxophrys_punicea_v1_NODE_1228_length_849_cov_5.944584.p3 type:complete len:100 gc:universal NODE_1228_length_849_cov_5.944584:848-549(-)